MALILAMASCGADGPDGPAARVEPTPPAVAAASPDDVAAAAVGVLASGCTLVARLGSGVATGRPGVVVTAAHTLSGATAVDVVTASGETRPATVVAFDPEADLAALSVDELDVTPLSIAELVTVGPAQFATWNRDDGSTARSVEVTRRLDITIEDIYVENTVQRSGLEISGVVEVGDSGGAVVNPFGEVMGIVYANSRIRGGVGFATDITEIGDLLATIDGSGEPVDTGRCV